MLKLVLRYSTAKSQVVWKAHLCICSLFTSFVRHSSTPKRGAASIVTCVDPSAQDAVGFNPFKVSRHEARGLSGDREVYLAKGQ